jgi:hypothetical protein
MQRIAQFVGEAGGWAVASGVAGLCFFLFGIWDRAHGGSISAFVFVVLSVPLFWVGAIMAYLKKSNELETVKKAREIPELYLQYVNDYRNDLLNSGFFLRVEGERKACNVEISSEETVGDHHVRLGMRWSKPGHPIGKDPVAVGVECVSQQDGIPSLYHNRMGDQIYTFFDHKRDDPRELIVTLNYTDVSGEVCPARRFRVHQDVPHLTDGRISCEPVKIRGAS